MPGTAKGEASTHTSHASQILVYKCILKARVATSCRAGKRLREETDGK